VEFRVEFPNKILVVLFSSSEYTASFLTRSHLHVQNQLA